MATNSQSSVSEESSQYQPAEVHDIHANEFEVVDGKPVVKKKKES